SGSFSEADRANERGRSVPQIVVSYALGHALGVELPSSALLLQTIFLLAHDEGAAILPSQFKLSGLRGLANITTSSSLEGRRIRVTVKHPASQLRQSFHLQPQADSCPAGDKR